MSLGGYLASLCAGLSDDFDFLIPLVPPACMGDLAWRVYRCTGHHRAGLDETLTEENMRAAFYIHSPLAHPRKIARERILIAAGAGDRIVPPEHPSALWEHWERPRYIGSGAAISRRSPTGAHARCYATSQTTRNPLTPGYIFHHYPQITEAARNTRAISTREERENSKKRTSILFHSVCCSV